MAATSQMQQHLAIMRQEHPVVFFAACGVLAFVGLLLYYSDRRAIGVKRRPDLHMTPGAWPLVGHLPRAIKRSQFILEDFHKYRMQYRNEVGGAEKAKALTMTMPGVGRMIDITRPDWIEYVQRTNFANYVKGDQQYSRFRDVLGDGIFSTDGKTWEVQRKATSKIFTANHFRGVISTAISRDLDVLIKIVGRRADRGEAFDLHALFFDFTLDSFSRLAFSRDVHALTDDKTGPLPFAVAFDFAQLVMQKRFTNPIWKITEMFNEEGRRMRESITILDKFCYDLIEERQQKGLDNIASKSEAQDLLSMYMALRDENGSPLSKKMLRDAVLNLIIAGRDTTAQALSWLFFRMLQNPETLKTVQAEVDEFGELNYDNFKSAIQANAAFSEGLRLHPSVPKNGWFALNDDVLPNGGPVIGKGDIVRWSDWEMARDTTVWGPDAAEFKPSRWIDESGQLRKETQWKYHVFNGGARLCLGQQLATFEGVSVLTALLRHFDFEFAPGYLESVPKIDLEEQTPRYANSLTLPMAQPLMVKATRRAAK